MRALVHRWGAYTEEDVIHYLNKMNIQTIVIIHPLSDKNHDELFEKKLKETIRSGDFDFVFSVNYFPVIAKASHECNLKYVSWSYDAPLNVINIEETLGLSSNIVYMFDKVQVEGYREKGFDNVYHLPLAVPIERYDAVRLTTSDTRKYSSDISFVGNLYSDILGSYISPLTDYDKGYIEAVCSAQQQLYGAYIIDNNISDELIERINNKYREIKPDTDIVLSREALSYAMASYTTRKERLSILGVLSKKCDLKYYSGEENAILSGARFGGKVDYRTDMPKVFKASGVNLNITLKILQSGIPLRALDIMGCGGFLLSNYQPELAEYFEDEKDVVMYTSMEDAVSKAIYYASNKDKANKIALSGYEKVKRRFSYQDRLSRIISDISK